MIDLKIRLYLQPSSTWRLAGKLGNPPGEWGTSPIGSMATKERARCGSGEANTANHFF